MITGTFYGTKVRVDTSIDSDVIYQVKVQEYDGTWTIVATFSEAEDPFCYSDVKKLAERLRAKVESL